MEHVPAYYQGHNAGGCAVSGGRVTLWTRSASTHRPLYWRSQGETLLPGSNPSAVGPWHSSHDDHMAILTSLQSLRAHGDAPGFRCWAQLSCWLPTQSGCQPSLWDAPTSCVAANRASRSSRRRWNTFFCGAVPSHHGILLLPIPRALSDPDLNTHHPLPWARLAGLLFCFSVTVVSSQTKDNAIRLCVPSSTQCGNREATHVHWANVYSWLLHSGANYFVSGAFVAPRIWSIEDKVFVWGNAVEIGVPGLCVTYYK